MFARRSREERLEVRSEESDNIYIEPSVLLYQVAVPPDGMPPENVARTRFERDRFMCSADLGSTALALEGDHPTLSMPPVQREARVAGSLPVY